MFHAMKKRIASFSSEAGFTLIELIVVIVIMGILAGVAVPTYSGYVEKANIAADESLISGVENALLMGAYGGQFEPGTAVGVVGLSETGGTTDNPVVNAMVANAFGENWEETSVLKSKKYKGGTDSSNILNAIAKSAYKNSIPTSSYYTNGTTQDLMGQVDNIVTSFAGVLGNRGSNVMQNFWSNEFLAEMDKRDLTDEYSDHTKDESKNLAANMTVFAAAYEIAGAESSTKNTWVSQLSDSTSSASGGGMIAPLVLNFAKYTAFSNANPEVQNRYNQLVTDLGNITRTSGSEDSYVTQYTNKLAEFERAIKRISGPQWEAYHAVAAGQPSQAQIDAEAFIATMEALNSVQDNYMVKDNISDFKQDDAFQKSDAANQLNAMVAYSQMENLDEVKNSDYVISLTIGADGMPVVSPSLKQA